MIRPVKRNNRADDHANDQKKRAGFKKSVAQKSKKNKAADGNGDKKPELRRKRQRVNQF